jgi:glycosyltransferase involved in cell wall biosynthesis
MPAFSVIICTYNRGDLVASAVQSVLDQTFPDFEVVVVDDGSTDDTLERVAAIPDLRVRSVRRDNGGLSAARNTGVAASCGTFVTFLDDDDRPETDWLEQFAAVLGTGARVVSCGARWITETGEFLKSQLPTDLGPAFSDYRGMFQAGTFALTREAFDAIGGFAEELFGSHQTELALRLLPYCREHGWPVGTVDREMLTITAQYARKRARNNPTRLLATTSYIVDHHREQLAHDPELLANYYATAGVAAARAGRYTEARRLLREAVRSSASPERRRKHRQRWLLTFCPPMARRLWQSDRFDATTMQ